MRTGRDIARTTAIVPVLIALGLVGGCANSAGGDWAGTLTDRSPERLYGVSLGYDVTKLISPDPTSPVPPAVAPAVRPGAGPVRLTVWWQTPDGPVQSEERPAASVYEDPARYAGAAWVKVTPVGTSRAQLAEIEAVDASAWSDPRAAVAGLADLLSFPR